MYDQEVCMPKGHKTMADMQLVLRYLLICNKTFSFSFTHDTNVQVRKLRKHHKN